MLNRAPRSLRRLARTPRVAVMTYTVAHPRMVPTGHLHRMGQI